MPVYKYKTLEDAEKALWNFEPDESYYERVAKLFEFSQKLNPIRFPKGVFKYKTLEEANRQRDQWVLEHIKNKSGRRSVGKD